MKTLVIYHANCADGFCSAWLLSKTYPEAEFVPAHYGDDSPDCKGKRVIVADFSYDLATMLKIHGESESLTVLDHHATAEVTLAELASNGAEVIFDNSKCGARLVWEYLHPDEPASVLVELVEDRDMWKWKLEGSKEFSAAIRSYPMTFEAWDELAASLDVAGGSRAVQLLMQGKAILRAESQTVDSHCEKAVLREIASCTVPVLNATTQISEIGNKLSVGHPFSATYFDDLKSGWRVWSLRSQKDGEDVGAIAKSLGGGGHKHAAGFQQTLIVMPVEAPK